MSASRERTIQRLAVALVVTSAAAGLSMVVLAAFPEFQLRHRVLAMAAAFIPYGILAWLVVTVILLAAPRRWIKALAVLSVAALALQVSWTRPYWPHDPAASAPDFTVMTLNTYYGWASGPQLMTEADRVQPDLVVLQEYSDTLVASLDTTDWFARLPYRVGVASPEWKSTNSVVFSRYPLTALPAPWDDPGQHIVRVALPSGPVTLVAAHVSNPTLGVQRWRNELGILQSVTQDHLGEPFLLVGDFNAVREHEPMRRLLSIGLTDAAQQSGTGWLPTFPSAHSYPTTQVALPVIGIDHVLLGPTLQATSVQSFRVDGTDHRGLVARIGRG